MGYLRAYQYRTYSGDPGFGSFLKKIGKGAAKLGGKIGKVPMLGKVLKMVPGVGTIAGIAGIAASGIGMLTQKKPPLPGLGFTDPFGQYGGTPGEEVPSLPGIGMFGGGGGAPRSAGGLYGRRRRINPTNPRALRRSISRLKQFRKLAHRVEMSLPKRVVHQSSSRGRK